MFGLQWLLPYIPQSVWRDLKVLAAFCMFLLLLLYLGRVSFTFKEALYSGMITLVG